MNMYLRHYFDPDFNYQELHPFDNGDKADRYNMGYVQSVLKGQILAELVPVESVENPISKFILKEPVLPQGSNTRIDPEHPNCLLADINGYVFYYDGKVSVKQLLNIRSDVDFHTGNIFFVGDVLVHKDIKAGFAVQANNILIYGMVEGGEARARSEMRVEGGARGGANNRCLLDAGKSLRIAFAEKIELRSRGKLLIEGFCMHSTVFVLGDFVVGKSLVGGVCRAAKHVLIKGNLGNRAGVPTVLHLGYDPRVTRRLLQFDKRLAALSERIRHYNSISRDLPPETNEITRKLDAAEKKRQMLSNLYSALEQTLQKDEEKAASCRLVVGGTVYPGVKISIASHTYTVQKEMSEVFFHLGQDGIIASPIPSKANVLQQK